MTFESESLQPKRVAFDLKGKNIIVYDLEIKKTIEQCAKGWDGHDEMGISVGCMFDYRELRYRVFLDDNISELADRINEDGTLVVAFNHVGFDNKLLRASGHNIKPDSELRNYDMLLVSRHGAGVVDKYQKGFKLDQHLQALKLPMKTGDGAMAPIWWQEGKIGKVIDYCLNDVTQERALFEYFYVHGMAACGFSDGERYAIERPIIG